MVDTIYIQGLNASTTIGVYDHERDIKQSLIIDLELGCDTTAAGLSDSFEDALDYDAIAKRTLEFVESSHYRLIEAVAENLSKMLFEEFPMLHQKITISKPGAVAIARDVGVMIERERVRP